MGSPSARILTIINRGPDPAYGTRIGLHAIRRSARRFPSRHDTEGGPGDLLRSNPQRLARIGEAAARRLSPPCDRRGADQHPHARASDRKFGRPWRCSRPCKWGLTPAHAIGEGSGRAALNLRGADERAVAFSRTVVERCGIAARAHACIHESVGIAGQTLG